MMNEMMPEKNVLTEKNIVVIYHKDCNDGFASAYVANKALGDTAEYYEMEYGQVWCKSLERLVKDKYVYLLDYTFDFSVMAMVANRAKAVTVIDHHKGAEKMLKLMPENVHVVFDIEHSACVLTWEHFFQEEEVPRVLQYIEDRDLWKHELYETEAVNAAISSYEKHFIMWECVLMPKGTDKLAEIGSHIDRYRDKVITEIINGNEMWLYIDHEAVISINAPKEFASDVGNILCEGLQYGYAVVWYATEDAIVCSLRSDSRYDVDVDKIAKKYGGGGHKHAAGMRIKLKNAKEVLGIDINVDVG